MNFKQTLSESIIKHVPSIDIPRGCVKPVSDHRDESWNISHLQRLS